MSFGKPRNHGCRISDDWTYKGMRTLILENELLRVTILVDKGSDIVEFRYKPYDLDFLYFAPGGIVNPKQNMPSAYTNAPYLDYFSGGWNDVLPNGGPFADNQGAILGQHGETPLARWDYTILKDDPQIVSVKLWVRTLRIPFFIEKTISMKPGSPVLMIEERVTNEGGGRVPFMWGQHIAFGGPFLDSGAVIHAPARRFLTHGEMPGFQPRRFKPDMQTEWPAAIRPDGLPSTANQIPPRGELPVQEMAYLTDLSAGWYAISSPVYKAGFAIAFDPQVFRYVWYWQQMGNIAAGYPWWNRTHTAALEPWTSYPTNGLDECIANGTALWLDPGATIETSLSAVAFVGFASIQNVDRSGHITGH